MVKIKTEVLQRMVASASKGAGNNKMLPITSMMSILVKRVGNESRLCLCTTDATNYLYVVEDIDLVDEFYVVVPQEQFSKLVSKLTSEEVSLELVSGKLVVKGNGTYNIELPLDETGNLVRYPNPVANLNRDKVDSLGITTIKSILAHNKPALAKTKEVPCYSGYYMDKNGVLTTDTYVMCHNDLNIFEEPVLLSKELVDLLDVFTGNEVEVIDSGSSLVFVSSNYVVYGVKMQEVGDYQVKALMGLITQDFTSKVEVSRLELISALDRLSLFVGRYDKNMINLNFSENALNISSKATSGIESLPYLDKENFAEFNCTIDIELFLSQIKAQDTDKVEIWFGRENAIKMVDGDVTYVVALGEDS